MVEDMARHLWIAIKDWRELDLSPIKAAKAELDLPFKVVPSRACLPDTPPSDVRILAIDDKPDWICDYVLVSSRTSLEGMKDALRWVLTGEGAEIATSAAEALNEILGPGVREISQAELDSEKALRIYLGHERG